MSTNTSQQIVEAYREFLDKFPDNMTQQAPGELSAQNIPQMNQSNPSLSQEIRRLDGMFTGLATLVDDASKRVGSIQEQTAKIIGPLPDFIAQQKKYTQDVYQAYTKEFRTVQEQGIFIRNLQNTVQERETVIRNLQNTVQERETVIRNLQKTLAGERERHQYGDAELVLLKQNLEEEIKLRTALEEELTKSRENVAEYETINGNLQKLVDAMEDRKLELEKENEELKAAVDKGPGNADADGMDVINWPEVVQGVNAGDELANKVQNLEEENADLQRKLQEANNAHMLNTTSRPSRSSRSSSVRGRRGK
ncbi:hypothetical protein K469DRAFT_692139 [Zopfia rhizophila CBS 207.26]|uniref:Uncharacterized protein n=1 Tax=Zopfia rhizophila CBS 207.26 TaxID=1314779 RepID=A0A6A6DSA1_9PEZI|nr:hypothetical protein K469DRAFT_692139 [Zopfia rhizophila CBS 207.26]